MRWILILATMSGCGGALECGPGTFEKDGVCVAGEEDTDTDTDTGEYDGGHPLAPEQYKWIWNVEGSCETYGNRQGNQVYILAEDVRVTADGVLSGTEKWYWFQAGEGWEGDCVDTFRLSGAPKGVDKGQYQCSQCEEVYEVERVLTDSTCDLNYNYFLFSYDWKEGFPSSTPAQSYPAVMLMDTLNPNGQPNEDNKMLMVHLEATEDGEWNTGYVDNDFARGHAVPDDVTQPGPPASYDWLAEKCIRTSW